MKEVVVVISDATGLGQIQQKPDLDYFFQNPESKPNFWREPQKKQNPTVKPDNTRRVFVRTKIGNFGNILEQYNLKTLMHLYYLFSNHFESILQENFCSKDKEFYQSL